MSGPTKSTVAPNSVFTSGRQQVALTRALARERYPLLLADKMAVLDAGQVLQHGTPAEVARHPAGPRVARLLGTEAPPGPS